VGIFGVSNEVAIGIAWEEPPMELSELVEASATETVAGGVAVAVSEWVES